MLLVEPRRFTKLLPAVICYPALQCVHVCKREREKEKERKGERQKERGWKIHTWHPLPAAPNLRGMDSFFPWHSFPSILFIFLQRLSFCILLSLFFLHHALSLCLTLSYSLSLFFTAYSNLCFFAQLLKFSTSGCIRPNFLQVNSDFRLETSYPQKTPNTLCVEQGSEF